MKQENGFTLVQSLLYVVMSAGILYVMSMFLFTIVQNRQKHEVISVVEGTGQQIMQLIGYEVRNAVSITSPVSGSSASSLTLVDAEVSANPTIFSLNGSTLEMTEGTGSAIPLTNNRLALSNLLFENVTTNDSSGSIRVSFTLSSVNPLGRQETAYEQVFTSSITVR